MKTNRGKGFFYSMGARDQYLGLTSISHNRKGWPQWAFSAYNNGWYGIGI